MSNNPFKKLAGQTMVYGLGTMVPRLLNYLLVPLYTRAFAPEVYGQFTELYAYVALLMALLTYGMETTFFRFGKGADFRKVYGTIMTSILSSTALFVVLIAVLHPVVAQAIHYEGRSVYVLLLGLVVAADVVSAVPFCVLRQQNQARRFSLIKIANVCTNVALNLLFIVVMPETSTRLASQLFGPRAGLLTWVFVSNLVASLLNLFMLRRELRQVALQWNPSLLKKLLNYGLPIMLIGLIGMVNEVADKLAIRYLLPPESAMEQLGIYGANYKLAVLMTIFVQMFRYASEPFFFSKAEERNSPRLFADVMTYFVICGLAIFLVISLFLDLFGYFVGNSGSAYREGLSIVPVVLMANLFYGIVFNLSIWYKLSDRTRSGSLITAAGAAVTVACLVGLVPVVGYRGAAWAHLACYSVMMVISYAWGQRVFPIPYDLRRVGFYFVLAVALYGISRLWHPQVEWLDLGFRLLLLLIFLAVAVRLDLRKALQ